MNNPSFPFLGADVDETNNATTGTSFIFKSETGLNPLGNEKSVLVRCIKSKMLKSGAESWERNVSLTYNQSTHIRQSRL